MMIDSEKLKRQIVRNNCEHCAMYCEGCRACAVGDFLNQVEEAEQDEQERGDESSSCAGLEVNVMGVGKVTAKPQALEKIMQFADDSERLNRTGSRNFKANLASDARWCIYNSLKNSGYYENGGDN